MKVSLPGYSEQILEPQTGFASREWMRWFQQLSAALGFAPDTAIYSDLWTDAHQMNLYAPGGGGIPAHYDVLGLNGDLAMPGFDPDTDTIASFGIRLPNNYREGTDLVPFFYWFANSALTTACRWVFGYSAAKNGSVFGSEIEEVSLEDWGGVADAATRVALTAIDGDDFVKGTVLACKIARDANHSDDKLAVTAGLIGFGFKYEIDGAGWEVALP